jgi:flotillin
VVILTQRGSPSQSNAPNEAWTSYGQAAILDQLLEQLPAIAAAVSEPLSKSEKSVVIGGSGNGGTGISRVTRDAYDIIAQMPAVVEALTGVDLVSTIQHLGGLQPTVNGKTISVNHKKN